MHVIEILNLTHGMKKSNLVPLRLIQKNDVIEFTIKISMF